METITKTVYLCSGKHKGIEATGTVKSTSSSTSTSGTDTIITIPLVKTGVVDLSNAENLSVSLIPTNKSWVAKYKPRITWEMLDAGSSGKVWINAVLIMFNILESCRWQSSKLWGFESGDDYMIVYPPTGTWEIPDNKSDVIRVKDWKANVTSMLPIPGELILADHQYGYGGPVSVPGVYFRTSAMTGGHIVSRKAHDIIPNLLVYDIECEGGHIFKDVLPTDFHLYNVGDWVFPLTIRDTVKTLERTELTCDKLGTPPVRLAPISVRFKGPAFSYKHYLDFSQYANIRILEGVIDKVDKNENKADVTVLGTKYYNIPIMYECLTNGTTDGRTAFVEKDNVLLIHDGYKSSPNTLNMYIIGFQDKVVPCIRLEPSAVIMAIFNSVTVEYYEEPVWSVFGYDKKHGVRRVGQWTQYAGNDYACYKDDYKVASTIIPNTPPLDHRTNNWFNDDFRVEWYWRYFRYAVDSYWDGEQIVWVNGFQHLAPVNVRGACVSEHTFTVGPDHYVTKSFLMITGRDGSIWRREIYANSGKEVYGSVWEPFKGRLSLSIAPTNMPLSYCFWSANGLKTAGWFYNTYNNYVCEAKIDHDKLTVSCTYKLVTTGTVDNNRYLPAWKQAYAFDYLGDSLCIATLESTNANDQEKTYLRTTTGFEFLLDDRNGSTLTGVWIGRFIQECDFRLTQPVVMYWESKSTFTAPVAPYVGTVSYELSVYAATTLNAIPTKIKTSTTNRYTSEHVSYDDPNTEWWPWTTMPSGNGPNGPVWTQFIIGGTTFTWQQYYGYEPWNIASQAVGYTWYPEGFTSKWWLMFSSCFVMCQDKWFLGFTLRKAAGDPDEYIYHSANYKMPTGHKFAHTIT